MNQEYDIIHAIMLRIFQYKKILFGALGFLGIAVASFTFVRAFIATDFSYTGTGHTSAFAGDVNVLLADFTGPAPTADSILLDGASPDPVAGDSLAPFSVGERFLDTDGEVGFTGGEPIITSEGPDLDTTGTVVTGSTANVLTAFPTAEGQDLYGFVDANANSVLNDTEDILRQVVSGNSETLTTGDPLRLLTPGDNVYYVAATGGSVYDDQTPSAIIQYTGPSESPFTLLRGGTMNFRVATLADNICLEDSDSSGDISPGDDFWRDLNGTDCSSFDTGVDAILTGDGGVTGPPYFELNGFESGTPYGDVTPGYIDGNGNGLYDCTRASCEALLAAFGNVANGEVVATALITGPSPDAIDGVATTGIDWIEDPTLMNAYDLSTLTVGGEQRFTYVDSDANTAYTSDEDMIELVKAGNADVLSTGDLFTNMTNAGWFADMDANLSYTKAADVLISSLDAKLDGGALDGSGTDEVIIPSTNGSDLSSFDAQTTYADTDLSSSYNDGEDIVFDTDSSTYFNADDLETISFTNTITDYPIEDADLAHVYVYKKVGLNCAGSGTDLLVGEKASSPFLDASILITDDVFTSATNYCVYADILSSARAGRYASLAIPQSGASFLGGIDSPSDELFSMGASNSYTSVSRLMSATMVPGSVLANDTVTYTTTFTTSAALTTGDAIRVVFPAAYDVTSAIIACTDDGSPFIGTSSVSGQIASRTLSTDINAGSDILCMVSNVVNPQTDGDYSDFIVSTVRQTDYDTIRTDVDLTFSAVTITPSAITHKRKKIDPAIAPTITITSPAKGISIRDSSVITWEDSGTPPGFANILYIVGGVEHSIAHNISDTGHYTWTIPSHLTGQHVDIKVELTDLATPQASAIVSVVIGDDTIGSADVIPEQDLDSKWYMPDISTRLVKIPDSPTVYYVGFDHRLLRPFLTEDIFYSWRSNFDKVRIPEPVELAQFPIGAPMTPMAGTYLIKSPNDPKVYVMEPVRTNKTQPILHWLSSEAVAEMYFGNDWGARVLDVPDSVIDLSPKGYDLVEDEVEPWFISIYFK